MIASPYDFMKKTVTPNISAVTVFFYLISLIVLMPSAST